MNDRDLRLTGMACLAVAILSRWFLRPAAGLGQELFDGTNGVLIGISIGCLLFSLWRRKGSVEGR